MLNVALTGNIAAGKSTVVAHFQHWGATIIDADALAREAQAPGGEVLAAIAGRFGADVLAPDGTLDRGIHEPLVNAPVFDEAAFSIFLVGRLAAIEPMYGAPLARDFCLVEAGAILQLLMLAAPAHAIGLCPVGRLEFEPVASALGLQESDFLAHSLLGGSEGTKR